MSASAALETREHRLLAALAARRLHRAASPPAVTDGIDWQSFGDLTRQHRMVPVIWPILNEAEGLGAPDTLMRDLRDRYQENALYCMRAMAHLTKIAGALHEAAIQVLPLKGICVAALFYGDIASRHGGDIDLLVAPEHHAGASAVMRELGYFPVSNATRVVVGDELEENDTRFKLHSMFVAPDGVIVELHFQLHLNPAVLPLHVDGIIAAGETVQIGRNTLPAMPAALQFVFLATHGARHEWCRLQWVYDIAIMTDRATDDEVRAWQEEAHRHRLSNPAIQALVLAHRIFGAALPDEALAALRRSLRIRYMVRRAEIALAAWPEVREDEHDIKLGRRLYRACVTSRPSYLWHEARDGFRAAYSRLSQTTASGSTPS